MLLFTYQEIATHVIKKINNEKLENLKTDKVD